MQIVKCESLFPASQRKHCHGCHRGGLASIHVGFVLDKVAFGQVFLQLLRFSRVSIVPPMLHIHYFTSPTLHDCSKRQGR